MICVDNLVVHAGQFTLEGASLVIPTGEYGALMGRTGCGKTTLLEAICGLKRVSSGTIALNGVDVTRMKPALRGVGFVPQDGALFSRMTVRQHLGFALEIRREKRSAIALRVNELAELLGIGHLLSRTPLNLSGGERQRVALGRALAFRPRTLLMDEPLSAVDEETREEMYGLLKSVQRHTGATTLHITHNREEARTLADRLFRMEGGKLEELTIENA
jgi:molybdate/tungstate transport system ATP-binding protein